ncbi:MULTISPECIES: RNA-binding protein [unclassified Oceanispirochaeta]|uniref:RNA recognition motif domain-containing protein n=1 Tax=unclassified Oceanispirochaeta TaxID=2635722 RepID=UPI001314390B|nr:MULTISPECIES: RNA-binding protein [unclassified Oceanispirochaeta]MBF9016327.1 RNA-binding protein [Oceanispirochaeta sp. M2]NPD72790.1 RNA-binding protein [Oceanispirochaeta sp. M1]
MKINDSDDKLFFGNLNYDVTEEDLREMLLHFGDIVSINHKQMKGSAIIHFAEPADAELAMKSLEDMDFFGRKLRIEWPDEIISVESN